jgi:hypothetical protein
MGHSREPSSFAFGPNAATPRVFLTPPVSSLGRNGNPSRKPYTNQSSLQPSTASADTSRSAASAFCASPAMAEPEVEVAAAAAAEMETEAPAAAGLKREREEGGDPAAEGGEAAEEEAAAAAKKPRVESDTKEEKEEETKEEKEGEEGKKGEEAKGKPVKLGPKEFATAVEMFDYFLALLHSWSPQLDFNKVTDSLS